MNSTRRSTKLLALAAAAALVAAACGSDDDDGDSGEGTTATTAESGGEDTTATTEGGDSGGSDDTAAGGEGGTLIWAHEQEPPDMHLDDPNNNLSITSYIQQALLDGLYTITAATEFAPELLAQEGEIVENDDGSVTVNFVLRDGLVWSDG
ncbi:MAG: hypothetical protein AAGA42_21755, partial [Actinomycetota bacterium]